MPSRLYLDTAYAAAPTNLLSAELNGLAVGSAARSTGTFTNAAGYLYGDLEFDTGSIFGPSEAGVVSVWFLRSLDGVTVEDGSAAVIPARLPDVTIPVGGQAMLSGIRPGSAESPEGTTVTSTTGVIYASQTPGSPAAKGGPFTTFRLTAAGQVLRNGVQDTGISTTAALYYHNHTTYAAASQTTGVVPSPASAVGFNLQTFGPAMTFAANPTLPLGGANWAPFSFFGVTWASIVVAQNPDGSLGLATGNMGDGYGGQLCTAVYDAAQPGYFRGHAFGGGAFFEATLSFTGRPALTGVSFWSNDIESMAGGSQGDLTLRQWPGQAAGYGDWIELDFPEFDTASTTQYGQGIHNWYGTAGSPADVNTGSYPGFLSPITVPLGTDFSQPHKYGFLWVPATGVAGPPTNIFANSSLSGASVGTPGVLPTGVDATSQAQGLTFQVTGAGTDVATGNKFFDLLIHGTGAGTGDCNIYLSGLNGTPTQATTSYTLSVGLSIPSGSIAHTTGIFIASNDLDVNHGFIQGAAFQSVSLTGSVQTFTPAFATTASTAYNTFAIGIGNPANGQPINITLRIENPQILQATAAAGQGYAKWFFDDVQVGTTVLWNKYDPALAPPPVEGSSAFSVMDTRHFSLILGLGDTANPVTIYAVSVWQASAANNKVV